MNCEIPINRREGRLNKLDYIFNINAATNFFVFVHKDFKYLSSLRSQGIKERDVISERT